MLNAICEHLKVLTICEHRRLVSIHSMVIYVIVFQVFFIILCSKYESIYYVNVLYLW